MTAEQVLAAVVVTAILIPVVRWVGAWLAAAVAAHIVKAINGQLGLQALRDDVKLVKGQVENLEQQLEVILTDL